MNWIRVCRVGYESWIQVSCIDEIIVEYSANREDGEGRLISGLTLHLGDRTHYVREPDVISIIMAETLDKKGN